MVKYCTRCRCEVRASVVKTICSNGVSLAYWWCSAGHRLDKSGTNLSHREIRSLGLSIESLPVISNNADVLCEVVDCQNLGVEGHHWAPRAIFQEPEAWPYGSLCRTHHMQWHEVIERYFSDKYGSPNRVPLSEQDALDYLESAKRFAKYAVRALAQESPDQAAMTALAAVDACSSAIKEVSLRIKANGTTPDKERLPQVRQERT